MLPWRDKSPETEQERFIERWRRREVNFAELCRRFGISRKSGYKRIDRFRDGG